MTDDSDNRTSEGAPLGEQPIGARVPRISPHPLRDMLTIALPSVATMGSHTVMQFIDKLMVSRIGPDPVYVAAQSNGGMTAWMAISFLLGMTGVINSFVSQNLGAGRPERGAAYAWNGLWICVPYYLMVVVPLIFIVPRVYGHVHGDDPVLAELESGYARIMLLGALAMIWTRTIHHYFYGMHRPWVVLISAVVGNTANIVANYALIFGKLGAPELGLIGAAVGTVIGSLIEFAIPMALFLSPKYARLFGTRRTWRLSKACLAGIWRVGVAPGLMFLNEMACWYALMIWLVYRAGEAAGDDPVMHTSMGWIALQYMHLSFMPAVGLSIAAQAMVGKAMGMKRPDIATKRTALALKITMGYMGLCALAFVLFPRELVSVFIDDSTPPEERAKLIEIGSKIMIAAAVFQVFDALAITTVGALRGAGDTVWPGVATIVLSWVCIVGVGRGMIEVAPGLGSLGPWIGAALFIVLLGIALGARFLGGKWKTMSLVDEGAGPDLDPFDDVVPDPTMTADL